VDRALLLMVMVCHPLRRVTQVICTTAEMPNPIVIFLIELDFS
jgi:hypothetical protein